MEQLSAAQHNVVTFRGRQRHMLVEAAPGSGKTHTLAERIAFLIEHCDVDAENMLALTFTNMAADEMRRRLDARLGGRAHGLVVDTFHGICTRWLREYGMAVGIPPSFVVCDDLRRQEFLRRAAKEYDYACLSPRQLAKEASAWKRHSFRGGMCTGQSYDWERIEPVAQRYQMLLREHGAIDYDDQILEALRLLNQEHELTWSLQRRFAYVFVDEYHDVSPELYGLLEFIVPKHGREQSVMVVADRHQSIYGWRYADAPKLLGAFCRDYRPVRFKLAHNYRSVGQIVRAANHVISAGGTRVATTSFLADNHPLDFCLFADIHAEARWIARQIARMTESGVYRLDDIAMLFRANRRADRLETELLLQGIAVERSEDGRFWDDPDVQGALRYLALVAALHDQHFVPALNWPRVLVDELTMLQLRRLASNANIELVELAQQIDRWSDMVSPLTRATIRDFLGTVGQELLAVADQPITTVVARLLALLRGGRDPFPATIQPNMHGFLGFLARRLTEPVRFLRAALAAKKAVLFRHDGSLDAIAAAAILEHALVHYLEHTPTIVDATHTTNGDAFVVTLGTFEAASSVGFGLAIRDARTLQFSISTQAWRLAQMLLLSYEHARDDHFVVVDLETSGLHHATAEILEIGAVRIAAGRATGQAFHSLVQPTRPVPFDSTMVHGLRTSDVCDAPPPATVIPRFVEYVGATTLVGHNIGAFDQRVLARVAEEVGIGLSIDYVLDTCELARRLLPNTSHRLDDLARRWDVKADRAHRALDDVRTNVLVFEHLLDLLEAEKELDCLSEVLPLVALGIVGAGVALEGENDMLVQAGARQSSHHHTALRARVAALASDTSLVTAEQVVAAHPAETWEDDRRWEAFETHWHAALAHYCATASDQSLAAFLRYAALATHLDEPRNAGGRVTMTTIHGSKGMEWPVVFLIGAEDDAQASYTTVPPDEERRVWYVGMTRAQRRLCVTSAEHYDGRNKEPLHFFEAIPSSLIRPSRRTG